METNYIFTVTKDGEVIFTKEEDTKINDYMYMLFTPMEILTMAVSESFDMADVNAEEYAKELKVICLKEYARAFKNKKSKRRIKNERN